MRHTIKYGGRQQPVVIPLPQAASPTLTINAANITDAIDQAYHLTVAVRANDRTIARLVYTLDRIEDNVEVVG